MKLPDRIYAYSTESRGHIALWKWGHVPSKGSVEYVRASAANELKDGDVAKLVNDLRDTAEKYAGTQQLRERIAAVVRQALHRLPQ